ncbi:MAG TPA: ATP-binding protein [Gemmatimonadales bacterium]|jgi:two-component system CheB/CheR fusion protein
MARKPTARTGKADTGAAAHAMAAPLPLNADQSRLLAHTWEPVMIFEFTEGTLLYWNPAAEETYGYHSDDALGRNIHDLLQTTPEVGAIRAEVERSGRWSGELSHRRKDGTRISVEARIVLVPHAGGPIVAVESTRDVSERKAMVQELKLQTEELRAADQDRNQFLAVLAHELRNPLGALRNVSQVLRMPNAIGELDRARAIMNRQIQNMARMIDDLLDVARISQGQIELRCEQLDLNDVIGRAVESVARKIDERGQRLSVTLSDDPVTMEGDEGRLEQVFSNLLGNASRFTNAGGQIWLTSEVRRRPPVDRAPVPSGPNVSYPQVIIRLRDDGIGIVPAVLPRVFNLFVQAERSPERLEGGLGLGLTLVKRVVELHAGAVEASSAGAGLGSEFTICLPINRTLVGEAHSPSTTEARPSSLGQGRRILVVDDEADSAETLALLLRERGHEVRVELDANAALESIAGFGPEIAILDIALPGMDGYDLAAALKRKLKTVRLIALSGYRADDIDPTGKKRKIFEQALEKPIDPEILYRILDRG